MSSKAIKRARFSESKKKTKQGHLVALSRECFPDPEITKQMTRGRTKTTSIINHSIPPYLYINSCYLSLATFHLLPFTCCLSLLTAIRRIPDVYPELKSLFLSVTPRRKKNPATKGAQKKWQQIVDSFSNPMTEVYLLPFLKHVFFSSLTQSTYSSNQKQIFSKLANAMHTFVHYIMHQLLLLSVLMGITELANVTFNETSLLPESELCISFGTTHALHRLCSKMKLSLE